MQIVGKLLYIDEKNVGIPESMPTKKQSEELYGDNRQSDWPTLASPHEQILSTDFFHSEVERNVKQQIEACSQSRFTSSDCNTVVINKLSDPSTCTMHMGVPSSTVSTTSVAIQCALIGASQKALYSSASGEQRNVVTTADVSTQWTESDFQLTEQVEICVKRLADQNVNAAKDVPYGPNVDQSSSSFSASAKDVSDLLKDKFHDANIDQPLSMSSMAATGFDDKGVNRVVEKFDVANGDQSSSLLSVSTSGYDENKVKEKSDNKSNNVRVDHSSSASTSKCTELVKDKFEDTHFNPSLPVWSMSVSDNVDSNVKDKFVNVKYDQPSSLATRGCDGSIKNELVYDELKYAYNNLSLSMRSFSANGSDDGERSNKFDNANVIQSSSSFSTPASEISGLNMDKLEKISVNQPSSTSSVSTTGRDNEDMNRFIVTEFGDANVAMTATSYIEKRSVDVESFPESADEHQLRGILLGLSDDVNKSMNLTLIEQVIKVQQTL
jgi:hypothetical protein